MFMFNRLTDWIAKRWSSNRERQASDKAKMANPVQSVSPGTTIQFPVHKDARPCSGRPKGQFGTCPYNKGQLVWEDSQDA